jgi:hypothetical protein
MPFDWNKFLADHPTLKKIYARCVFTRGPSLILNEVYHLDLRTYKSGEPGFRLVDKPDGNYLIAAHFEPWFPRKGERVFNKHISNHVLISDGSFTEWDDVDIPEKFYHADKQAEAHGLKCPNCNRILKEEGDAAKTAPGEYREYKSVKNAAHGLVLCLLCHYADELDKFDEA